MTIDPKQRLLRNVTSNWVQMAIYTVIALVMTPFVVHALGKDVYGIWALIFSIIHYTNFFDVGFKQSLARYLPKYYATQDYEKLNEVINSSSVIYAVSGTLVLITAAIIAAFFVDYFAVSEDLLPLMRIALIIMGVNQAMYFYLMASTALGPFHRYDLLNAIEIGRTLVGAACTIVLLMQGYGLIALALVTLLTNFGSLLLKRFFQHRIVPQIEYNRKYVNRQRIRELFNYGLVSFLIVMAWIVIFSTDNIVVGMFISTQAVAYFNIAGTIINNLRSIVASIGTPLVPVISHLDATSDLAEIAALHRKTVRYLYYISTLIGVGVFFFGRQFVGLWMGPGFDTTVTILFILIAPACIYLPQMITNSVLLGIGRHPTLLYILGVEALANIGLSLALVHVWGVYGVALGTAIPQVVIYSFVYPYVFHRTIRARLSDFYRDSGLSIATALLFTLPVAWAVSYLPLPGWVGFLAQISAVTAVSLAGVAWRILDDADRRRFLGRFFRSRAAGPQPPEKKTAPGR